MLHKRSVQRSSHCRALPLVALFALSATAGCAPAEQAQNDEAQLALFDSVLADLGGPQTAELSRSQRWRLIASVGTGLPPTSYRLEDLPEQGSRAVGLQQAYCLQCHGVSSPRMHSSDEWPTLVRRMLMRGAALGSRLGGPRTEGMVDGMLMAGLRTAELPPAEDVDSLVAYFQRNAFPAAAESELPDTPDAALYVEKCSGCHDTPSPSAHPAEELQALVARMSALGAMLGMDQLTEDEQSRLVAFMQQSAP
ncbi:MAG: cytochrome c [Gemmatimonadetes bacterium]|nr:cytochrome c [Gemmatimonadota bacterium]